MASPNAEFDALVVDAAPLLTSTQTSLRGLAKTYHTVQGVVDEIRDKSSRDKLHELAWLGIEGGEKDQGLKVEYPSAEAIALGTYLRCLHRMFS